MLYGRSSVPAPYNEARQRFSPAQNHAPVPPSPPPSRSLSAQTSHTPASGPLLPRIIRIPIKNPTEPYHIPPRTLRKGLDEAPSLTHPQAPYSPSLDPYRNFLKIFIHAFHVRGFETCTRFFARFLEGAVYLVRLYYRGWGGTNVLLFVYCYHFAIVCVRC